MNVKHIEVGLNSNIGLRRKDNQDSACASHGVYVVCDGMGGGKGGKQASSDVAERFARLAELPTRDLDAIDETLILAQQEVLRLGEQLGGVAGTTISGVLLPTRVGDDAICSDERCYIVNVGDSRTYHMRADGNGAWLADSLTCITRDHSERQNAIDSGQMLPDEASRCIPRNIITQCVGAPAGISLTGTPRVRTDGSSSVPMGCMRRSAVSSLPRSRRRTPTRRWPRTCWYAPR